MKELLTYIVHIILSVPGAWMVFRVSNLESHFASNISVFLLIYFLFWLGSYFYDRAHFTKVPLVIGLLFYFLKELLLASFVVAWDVITPRSRVESGLIALPLDARTDLEITILASLISLTPGTLSLDVSEDKRYLYVHAVYIKQGDVENLRKQIKNGFEKKLLKITRKHYV